MPGGLSKNCKGKWVTTQRLSIRLAGETNTGEEFGIEQTQCGLHWLERTDSPEYFAAVVSRHANWGYSRGLLVYVEIRRMAHVNTAIGEVHRTLCVVIEA